MDGMKWEEVAIHQHGRMMDLENLSFIHNLILFVKDMVLLFGVMSTEMDIWIYC